MWYHKKKKFLDGIEKCLKLSDEEFTAALHAVYSSGEDLSALMNIDIKCENVTKEEKVWILKTMYYLVQRFSLFLLSPIKLQSDLSDLGFTTEKAQILITMYSKISRPLIANLDTSSIASGGEEEVRWEIKTTLADAANQKCKIPKAKITLATKSQKIVFDDLDHSELSRLFDKLESIQSELDNLSK